MIKELEHTKQVMPNAISHHPDQCPASSQAVAPGQLLPSLYTDHVTYHTECPFGQLESAVPSVSSPSFTLVGWGEELKSPQLSASTAQQQLKQCAINILLIEIQNTAMHQLLGRKLTAKTRTYQKKEGCKEKIRTEKKEKKE